MKNENKTVVVGLSGGVDSAVAAYLLKKKGYNVVGAFMKNYSDTKNPLTGECSYLEDKKMSQRIALHLDIPWMMFDFEKEYKKEVVEPMYRAYASGLTPNPDISCNNLIKFPLFWKEAKKAGADYIAMGHYARIRKTPRGFELLAGKDKKKDQSYFLAELNQSDLSHTLFPIGSLTKDKVREIAKRNKFPNWNKRGTRGICFVGNVNFGKFLEKKVKKKQGKVVTPGGDEIGNHPGIGFYTVGQKIGESTGARVIKPKGYEGKRFYVAEKKVGQNILVAAPEGHSLLMKKEIFLKNLHLINPKLKIGSKFKGRIRHLGELNSGKLIKVSGKWEFIFSKPVKYVAEGQFLVLYQGDKVVGCGEVCSSV